MRLEFNTDELLALRDMLRDRYNSDMKLDDEAETLLGVYSRINAHIASCLVRAEKAEKADSLQKPGNEKLFKKWFKREQGRVDLLTEQLDDVKQEGAELADTSSGFVEDDYVVHDYPRKGRRHGRKR